MINLVVLISDCVRPRASSIRLKQARKVLDLRGALGCTELDKEEYFPLRGTKPVLSL